ncbi:MAG TPA: uracil-DNA glycosylase [Methylomirabilota bacterium]|nr:uracil-DNA glycosylase [Methylomirabilota bacterium]
MGPRPPGDLRKKLEDRLRFYDDLRLGPYFRYRMPAGMPDAALRRKEAGGEFPAVKPVTESTPAAAQAAAATARARDVTPARPAQIASAFFLPVVQAPSLFDSAERIEGDTLEAIRADIGDCTRCRLHQQRNKIVFGDGNGKASLVFVGEGPGHDEDMRGIPFVGRAGQLLTQMIDAMGLRREDVYICNIVKCRPPENRLPEKDEIATCSPFLLRQIGVIQPKVIVCLGNVAAQTLLATHKSISQYRGQWFDYRGARMIATYHPAYLLRNPAAKADVWVDLKKVMVELGLPLNRTRRA